MAADSNDSKLGKSKIADFPSEHVLAHEGSEWQKSARSTLAAVHLAETGEVPMLEEIIDMPLDALPMLALGHRDYERRMVDRLKLTQENTKNNPRSSKNLMGHANTSLGYAAFVHGNQVHIHHVNHMKAGYVYAPMHGIQFSETSTEKYSTDPSEPPWPGGP